MKARQVLMLYPILALLLLSSPLGVSATPTDSAAAFYSLTRLYASFKDAFLRVARPEKKEMTAAQDIEYERYIELSFGVPLRQAQDKSKAKKCRKEDFWDFERCEWNDECPRHPYRVCEICKFGKNDDD